MSVLEPGVCVALDVPTLDEARAVVRELSPIVPVFKVGLELFCAEGPRTVDVVLESGAQVFLDLKVNDIPNTAAAAVREAGKRGASFITIHGFGGREMVRAAVEASREQGGPQLLVVSALTSFDDAFLAEVGVVGGVRQHAMRIGRMAAEEGAGGLVLSPRELDVVRSALPHLLLCTPGVRPAGTGMDDHRRALTPAEAVIGGADLIVVGRPILKAADRVAAARALIEEVREAEASREGRRAHEVVSVPIAEAEEADLMEDP
ncbi:MAG TPA: orotidine-5'-phosphate decarboxylase [Actinomycetota bacterium]|nr:orotidine-5'-phosphate decarboxylase [Actinomycetota bacterium]